MKSTAELLNAIYDALSEREFHGSSAIPLERFLRCLNRGTREVVLATHVHEIYVARTEQALTAGTGTYDFPATCLDRTIYGVGYIDGSSQEVPLDPASVGLLNQIATGWRYEASGTPVEWFVDPYSGKLRVRPPPDAPNTIAIYGLKTPPHLYRYWGTPVTTTLTANVTNGSSTVTLSSAASGHQFAPGDYFGVIDVSDTTGIETRTAHRFYKATTVSGTDVTLSESYEGANNGTAFFVTGQAVELLELYESLDQAIVWQACRFIAESVKDLKEDIAFFAGLAREAVGVFKANRQLVPHHKHPVYTLRG